MKTLVELLDAEWQRRVDEGIVAPKTEHIAGLVGAVQEWLDQGELREVVYGASWPGTRGALDALRVEAGRGLGE